MDSSGIVITGFGITIRIPPDAIRPGNTRVGLAMYGSFSFIRAKPVLQSSTCALIRMLYLISRQKSLCLTTFVSLMLAWNLQKQIILMLILKGSIDLKLLIQTESSIFSSSEEDALAF